MDVITLCDKVLESDEVKDIPVLYVYIIVAEVMDIIRKGECFIKTDFD